MPRPAAPEVRHPTSHCRPYRAGRVRHRLTPTGTRVVDPAPVGDGQATVPRPSRPVGARRASPGRTRGAASHVALPALSGRTGQAPPDPYRDEGGRSGTGGRWAGHRPSPVTPCRGAACRARPRRRARQSAAQVLARGRTPLTPASLALGTPSPAPRGRGGSGVRGLHRLPRLATPGGVGTWSVPRPSRAGRVTHA